MADCFDLKPGMMIGAALDSGAYVLDSVRQNQIRAFSRLGLQSCRLNLNWRLIEPEKNIFNISALENVKEDVIYLLALGVRPLICLCSECEPEWFIDSGGWQNKDNCPCFLIYAEKVVQSIGHLTSDYLTFSNINCDIIRQRKLKDKKKRLPRAELYAALSNAAYCHCRCYRMIHDLRREMGFKNSRVSFANSYESLNSGYVNPVLNKVSDALNEMDISWRMTRAMMRGEFMYPLRRVGTIRKGIYCDFHAVNYCSDFKQIFLDKFTRRNSDSYDAEGIVSVCSRLFKMLQLRIYITELICTDSRDIYRCIFLYEHLKALCESTLPVRRFYYGNFDDEKTSVVSGNGIAYLDGESVFPKRSGMFLGEIAKNGRINQSIYDDYIGGYSSELTAQTQEK